MKFIKCCFYKLEKHLYLVIIIALSLVIMIVSLAKVDIKSLLNIKVLFIDNFFKNYNVPNDFYSILITGQATIGTLIFSIIAILNGNIMDTYIGISISDFYLNKRKLSDNQREFINCFFLLTILEFLSYALDIKAEIIFCSIFTLIITYVSIQNIYCAFEGKYLIQHDVEEYLEKILLESTNCDFELYFSLFDSLSKDWLDKLESQNETNYIKYKEIFKKFILKLLVVGNDDILSRIDQICIDISKQFFKSENKIIEKRGMILLQEIYFYVWSEYHNKGKKYCESEEGFSFFKDIEFEISYSIKHFNYYEIEECVLDLNMLLNVLELSIVTTNKKGLYCVISSISNYLKNYFYWLFIQKYDCDYKIASKIYSEIFKINEFEGNKKIYSEAFSLLFFIYCRYAMDYGYILPILERISGNPKNDDEIIDDFLTLNNKEQSTSLLSIVCYVIFNKIVNKNGIERSIKESIIYNLRIISMKLIDNFKSSANFIDLDTYYLMIRMIKDSFFVEYNKVKGLREDYITSFFYFVLVYLSKNTNDKEVYEKEMIMLYRKVGIPQEYDLKNIFILSLIYALMIM